MSQTPHISELFRVFGRIGLLSFGGPAAQIGLMHQELVERRPWLKEKEFLGALSFCMLLPGPEAMQLATFCGWKLRGTLGGIIAGTLFVLPGAALIFCLAAGYATYGNLPLVSAAFVGVKAAVVAIILQALIGLSRKVLTNNINILVAAISFLALYSDTLAFPVVILLVGIFGMVFQSSDSTPALEDQPAQTPNPLSYSFKAIFIWGALWAIPVILLLRQGGFLSDVALFFSKLAIVSFGGAYALLAYMVQTVVQDFGWLSTDQMMDALGLAETTPGPLILVTQFVATLSGALQGGPWLALAAGVTALWCTFIPCFLWIFAGAPHVARILSSPRLNHALRAITAAVFGVILNLSVWFMLNLLFDQTQTTAFGDLPVLSSFDWRAGFLSAAAILALLTLRLPLLATLFISASTAAIFGAM
ncbi:chromate efflux transporter [Shimia sp. MMG029]|uniref:chromate efflux transporter n=1 Tax=Shimia sp. MMG029 TaxID=3021978 RepID=UPI0022FE5322|nr:chromate efflux transporter [Shimia sp. MMG029]MDA5555869.1 chromate efflux transporter [Shimia sp. MMG029]